MNARANHHPLRRTAAALLAAGLWAAAGASHAAIGGSVPDLEVVAGTPKPLAFTLDFGAGTLLTSFDYQLTYADPALALQEIPVASAPVLSVGALGSSGSFTSFIDPGIYSQLWYALDGSGQFTAPLSLSGLVTFTLKIGVIDLPIGQTAPVNFVFHWSDENGDEGNTVSLTSTVTAVAVPEPQSLALMLAGAGIVAAGVARRREQIRR